MFCSRKRRTTKGGLFPTYDFIERFNNNNNNMNKDTIMCFIGIFILILFIFQINAQICPPGEYCIPQHSNETAVPEIERNSPNYMTSEEFYNFVGNLAILIVIFIILAIIIIAFIKYSIKNKDNKKKFIFSLTSSILLFLDSIFFFIVWIPCIDGCDAWGEMIITSFLILPIAGLIIVPWIIYGIIDYFKKR